MEKRNLRVILIERGTACSLPAVSMMIKNRERWRGYIGKGVSVAPALALAPRCLADAGEEEELAARLLLII